MIHPIVKYGDPVLETPTKRVEKFDEDLQKLVDGHVRIHVRGVGRGIGRAADWHGPADHGD